MTYKTIYTHISSLHSPFSLKHLLLRDVALSVFMLPLNVNLVSPHNLLLACATDAHHFLSTVYASEENKAHYHANDRIVAFKCHP